MKNKTLYGLFLILAVFVTSCELPDNIDPKNAKTVSPNALFTQAEYALFQQVAELDYNLNCSRFLAQYLSEVTYTNETRYNFSDRQVPDNFSGILYRDALFNLKDCGQQIAAKAITPSFTEGIQKNQLTIINLLEIYAYHVLVDQFGDTPYTEALMGAENSRPAYDDALTIYQDLITRLNTVITDLDDTFSGFGDADILYNDDIVLWKKFAASLKLRIALRMADVPSMNSSALVSQALSAGVFTDQSESAIFHFYGIAPYVNPYYQAFVLNARKDFCPTNTIIDMMNALNDPRRAIWFTEYPAGTYTGLPYGKSGSSSYSKFSHIADNIRIDPEYPAVVMDYVEVEFLLAEAAARNLG
ncbi:MAG: SusD/RagB family nutrient-binding outer membrane lipoprotein, partial [Bacteroidales bacterium]